MSILTKIFGDPNEKVLREIWPLVDAINKLETKFKDVSDDELRARILKFKDELKDKSWVEQKEKLEQILPEVFALVRETARRKLNQRHFDEQLLGGVVLHRGQIAEMKTGEGKTLTASLSVVLNALSGRGAHIVTPNDYLSRVGGGWMSPVYHALGLSTGVIAHDFSGIYDPSFESSEQHGGDDRLRHWRPVSRKEAYGCDITYGTNNEFGFDYLRDNMAPDLEHTAQRGLHYAIVDEIDSILIDEARTPLIISAPAEESTDKYRQFAQLVTQLKENEDYNVDEKMRAATLTEDGLNKMEKLLGLKNIYTEGGVSDVHHIEQALRAHTLFRRDRDYVIKDGEVIIVDEFTGRLMPGRRYSEGLHQAIEAKEGVQVQCESMTLATITFQNYFRLYTKLAGMTGTAVTEAEEFHKIYNLETVVIPTHRPMVRKDLTDLVYATENGKFQAIVQEIKRRHQAGQPVLVGTISIEKNEILAEMLERAGVPAQVLNAKQHEKEAGIIAEAGKAGAVTIATNMAGRGVDIILGGAALDEAETQRVREFGGLHVIGTERHESRRIDNQLRGRSGRQGDPGSSQFYLSMEDDLMRIFGGDRMKRLMATLQVPEDTPIENKIIARSIEQAQKKVEAHNFDIRKHLVEYDDVINKHREAIYRRRREILNLTPALPAGRPNPSPLQGEDTRREVRLKGIILEMINEEIALVINFHTAGEDASAWNLKEIQETVFTIFPLSADFTDELKKLVQLKNPAEARQKVIEYVSDLASEAHAELTNNINEIVPSSRGEGNPSMPEIERQILIRAIDQIWTEHLDAMDQMRKGIGLRGYGQHDPLIEYKKESYRMFQQLNELIRKQVAYSIFKVADVTKFMSPTLLQRAQRFSAPAEDVGSFSSFKQGGNEGGGSITGGVQLAHDKIKDAFGQKVGRNDPCPCGAVKPDGTPIKYKHCHGK